MALKDLDNSPEWKDSSGNFLQMCVVEELAMPHETNVAMPAIVTLGGFSLCRSHMDQMVEYIQAGHSTSTIFGKIINGEF